MSQVVDSIIAELIVRDNGYIAKFDAATAAHERFTKSVPKVAGALSGTDAQGYADRHKKAANDVAGAAEASAGRVAKAAKTKSAAELAAAAEVKAAAKATADAQRAAAKAASDAVKAAEREKQAALKATQREQEKAAAAAVKAAEIEKAAAAAAVAAAEKEAATRARLAAVAERAVLGGVKPGSGRNLGVTSANEPSGQRSMPLSVLNGAGEADAAVAAETEVNHILAKQALLRSGLTTADKADAQVIRDKLGSLQLEASLRRAGVAEADILLALDQRALRVEAERALVAKKGGARRSGGGVDSNFLLSATGGRFGYSVGAGAVAGLATAAGVAIGAEVIASAVAYGKALQNMSTQLGITVEDLQAYQKIARDNGVTTEQMTSAFGHFSSTLGQAQQGSQEQIKLFKALGINVKDFASAGDALPTLIDRISSIKDPAQRAAVETRAFGEEGRRLDGLLSGGSASVSNLARSLQETGKALSAQEIKELDNTARKLAEVKNQLSVDLSRIVAGNSDAIISLANSFGTLSNSILGTIQKLQQFGAEQIRASSLASPNDKALARKFQLSTRAGRVQLFTDNTREIQQVRAGNMKFSVAPGAQGPEAQRVTRLAQLQVERYEIAKAEHDAKATPTAAVQGGVVSPRLLSTLGAPKGSKGKSAEALAKEAEAREKRFNDQMAGYEESQLRSMEEMTGDVEKQADIEKKLADRALAKQLADIKSQERENVLSGSNAGLEATRARTLSAEAQKAHDTELQNIESQKQLRLSQVATNHIETDLQIQSEQLNSLLGLAKTAKDRRIIELRLLDLAQQEEKARLEAVIKTSKPGDPAIIDAQKQIDALPAKRTAAVASINQRDQGPWQQYLSSLPSTAGQIEEAFEKAAVNGVERLNSSLGSAVSKMLNLHGVAGQFLEDLIQIGIQMAESAIFSSSNGQSSTGGGLVNSLVSAIGSIFGGGSSGGATGSYASGVSMTLGGNPGVDKNSLSFNGKKIGNVSSGEILSISPNVAASNQKVNSSASQVTVVAPQHFDLSNAVLTSDLVSQMNSHNRAYADAVGRASYQAAVGTAANQTPSVVSRYQQQKG